MAVDIGAEAINRTFGTSTNFTLINKTKPAEVAGLITSIDIWAETDVSGLRVGTFYTTNGSVLKCRASQAIEGTITAGSKVTKAVSIAVEIGDYIGFFFTDGFLEEDYTGFAGIWYFSGERIDPDDQALYSFAAGHAISLGGYLGVVGWTGEIAGVTNPASIMGKDVENIEEVKGVVSG